MTIFGSLYLSFLVSTGPLGKSNTTIQSELLNEEGDSEQVNLLLSLHLSSIFWQVVTSWGKKHMKASCNAVCHLQYFVWRKNKMGSGMTEMSPSEKAKKQTASVALHFF